MKKPFSRWSEEEREELFAILRAQPDTPADVIAKEFSQRHPKRGFNAIRQRVFKFRRSSEAGSQSVNRGAAVSKTSLEPNTSRSAVAPPLSPPLMTARLRTGERIRGTPDQVLSVLRGLNAGIG